MNLEAFVKTLLHFSDNFFFCFKIYAKNSSAKAIRHKETPKNFIFLNN